MANSHSAALYFAYSGATFEMQRLGRWWACIERESWPPGVESTILEDFEGEDGIVGDRRNEIVFIGEDLDEEEIRDSLQSCLLSESEMEKYSRVLTGDGKDSESHVDGTLEGLFPKSDDLQIVDV